jgi:hypothetical protein
MKPKIVQRHHLIYANDEHSQKEIVGNIYKGEHWLLTNLSRRTNISKVFIKSLKMWLILNEEKAVEL